MSVPTTLEKAQSIFRRQLGRQTTGPTRSITGATLTPEGSRHSVRGTLLLRISYNVVIMLDIIHIS